MSDTPSPRSALPWQAVVAATVLALTAAAMVFVIMDDGGDASVDTGSAAVDLSTVPSVDLVPDDGLDERDPLDVEFTDVDGTTGTIRDFIGDEPVVVNFFASWCPPCIGEMPDFEAVSQELAGKVDFLGIAVQDRPEDATEIVERTGITYDWTRDIRGDIVGAAGVVQMPTTMFISPDGTVMKVQGGALDPDGLRDLIEEHLGVAT